MSLIGWRLSKQRYAQAAFSGEGAKLYGGRWNSVGVSLVYTSLSLSLAVLEAFVHMGLATEPDDYVSVSVDFGLKESIVERVSPDQLPPNWAEVDHPALKEIGDTWAKSLRSAVLLVPSVVVEGEWNALINPLHGASKHMKRTEPKPFHFDQRMFRRQG